jgi:hypothetical protein
LRFPSGVYIEGKKRVRSYYFVYGVDSVVVPGRLCPVICAESLARFAWWLRPQLHKVFAALEFSTTCFLALLLTFVKYNTI